MVTKSKKRFSLLSMFTALIMAVSLFSPISIFAQTNSAEGKLSSNLIQEFEENDKVSFVVEFNEKANTAAAKNSVSLSGLSEKEAEVQQREAVISALQTTADKTQADVLSYLENNTDAEVKSFYIANILIVTATQEVAEEVAAFPEVKSVTASPEITLVDPVNTENGLNDIIDDYPFGWNVDHVKAPEAWDKGFDGEGIVIGNIDSGVQWDHPAIQDSYRGYNAETGEVDHSANFYDAINGEKEAYDDNGHGTHVTGTTSGQSIEAGDYSGALGVAPGSTWIAAKALNSIGSGPLDAFVEAAEWMLAPGGDAANAPDIINNSWGVDSGGETFDNEWFRDVIVSWTDANIFPVFAAGNLDNPEEGSIFVPALYPEAFTVGAIDKDNSLADFSAKGPSPYGEVKPEVVAPGVNVPSSYPIDDIAWAGGTSMAAPAVAGVVALAKQANEDATIEDIRNVLTETATNLTDDEFTEEVNNGFGHGLVNALKVVEEITEEEPTPDPDPDPEPEPKDLERIFGQSRYDTAIEISQAWEDDSVDTVIVARGDDYADALAGVPLAHVLDTPILLTTDNDKIIEKTLAEIERLGATEAIVLGGEGAIAPTTYNRLASAVPEINRLSGDTRFETAAEIAEAFAEVNGGELNEVVVANGLNFPDALTIGSFAAQTETPIVLTLDDRVPEATQELLDKYNVAETTVVGGEAVVNADVEAALPSATRLAGNDRYGTNVAILDHYESVDSGLYIATGKDYADALTGAVLAAQNDTAILLVHDKIPKEIAPYLDANDVDFSAIFGGKNAVGDDVKQALEDYLNE